MRKSTSIVLIWLITLSFAFSGRAQAQTEDSKTPKDSKSSEIDKILDGMGYPELQVVPKASERLLIEARNEKSNWWVAHWPIQLSGLATMGIGLSSNGHRKENLSSNQKTDADTISTLTTTVGAGWVIGGLILGMQKPYRSGMKSISKYNDKDKRSQLMRERLAEEALEKPARIMQVLQYVSTATNLTMNIATAAYSNDEGKVLAGVSAVLSFLPFMFEDNAIMAHRKHIEYKKKIYAPIQSASIRIDPETNRITPVTELVWFF